jgi:hypothetical protein
VLAPVTASRIVAARDDATDDSSAQIPLIHCRVRERVISVLLLPFPVGPGTGGERQITAVPRQRPGCPSATQRRK